MLNFICDVAQLGGIVFTRRLTFRAGHLTTEIKIYHTIKNKSKMWIGLIKAVGN